MLDLSSPILGIVPTLLESQPSCRPRKQAIRSLLLLGIAASIALPHALVAAPLSRPLLPIMFRTNISGTPYPNYTRSELDKIADQSEGMWGDYREIPKDNGEISDLSYLRSRNPGFTVLAYLNAGHRGWSEPGWEHVEDDRLSYIQVYAATELAASVNATDTQIPVVTTSKIPVSGGAVDLHTAMHSLDARTGANGGFISFVRIGSEVMRITGKSTNPPKLTVLRGTDGTNPIAHSAGEAVLLPVYVEGYNPNGSLAVENGYVRYSLNVGSYKLARFLSETFVEEYLRSGWDGAFLDVTAPSFYGMVDANNVEIDGESRAPFNTVDWEDYTKSTRAHHHDVKIGRIQSAVKASLGRLPYLIANNNGNGKWFDDSGYGRRFAMANQEKLVPADAVSLEAVFTYPSDAPTDHDFKGFGTWKKNVKTIAEATNEGLAVLPQIEFNDFTFIPEDADPSIQRYDWASILFAWGRAPGRSMVALELWVEHSGNANGRRLNLPDFLYHNLGEPVGPAPSTDDALEAHLIGSSTYKRDWTKGVILVNPKDSSDNDVFLSGYVDPFDCDPVTVSSMPANSSKILLKPNACS